MFWRYENKIEEPIIYYYIILLSLLLKNMPPQYYKDDWRIDMDNVPCYNKRLCVLQQISLSNGFRYLWETQNYIQNWQFH